MWGHHGGTAPCGDTMRGQHRMGTLWWWVGAQQLRHTASASKRCQDEKTGCKMVDLGVTDMEGLLWGGPADRAAVFVALL